VAETGIFSLGWQHRETYIFILMLHAWVGVATRRRLLVYD
jgi:hypothetical protein